MRSKRLNLIILMVTAFCWGDEYKWDPSHLPSFNIRHIEEPEQYLIQDPISGKLSLVENVLSFEDKVGSFFQELAYSTSTIPANELPTDARKPLSIQALAKRLLELQGEEITSGNIDELLKLFDFPPETRLRYYGEKEPTEKERIDAVNTFFQGLLGKLNSKTTVDLPKMKRLELIARYIYFNTKQPSKENDVRKPVSKASENAVLIDGQKRGNFYMLPPGLEVEDPSPQRESAWHLQNFDSDGSITSNGSITSEKVTIAGHEAVIYGKPWVLNQGDYFLVPYNPSGEMRKKENVMNDPNHLLSYGRFSPSHYYAVSAEEVFTLDDGIRDIKYPYQPPLNQRPVQNYGNNPKTSFIATYLITQIPTLSPEVANGILNYSFFSLGKAALRDNIIRDVKTCLDESTEISSGLSSYACNLLAKLALDIDKEFIEHSTLSDKEKRELIAQLSSPRELLRGDKSSIEVLLYWDNKRSGADLDSKSLVDLFERKLGGSLPLVSVTQLMALPKDVQRELRALLTFNKWAGVWSKDWPLYSSMQRLALFPTKEAIHQLFIEEMPAAATLIGETQDPKRRLLHDLIEGNFEAAKNTESDSKLSTEETTEIKKKALEERLRILVANFDQAQLTSSEGATLWNQHLSEVAKDEVLTRLAEMNGAGAINDLVQEAAKKFQMEKIAHQRLAQLEGEVNQLEADFLLARERKDENKIARLTEQLHALGKLVPDDLNALSGLEAKMQQSQEELLNAIKTAEYWKTELAAVDRRYEEEKNDFKSQVETLNRMLSDPNLARKEGWGDIFSRMGQSTVRSIVLSREEKKTLEKADEHNRKYPNGEQLEPELREKIMAMITRLNNEMVAAIQDHYNPNERPADTRNRATQSEEVKNKAEEKFNSAQKEYLAESERLAGFVKNNLNKLDEKESANLKVPAPLFNELRQRWNTALSRAESYALRSQIPLSGNSSESQNAVHALLEESRQQILDGLRSAGLGTPAAEGILTNLEDTYSDARQKADKEYGSLLAKLNSEFHVTFDGDSFIFHPEEEIPTYQLNQIIPLLDRASTLLGQGSRGGDKIRAMALYAIKNGYAFYQIDANTTLQILDAKKLAKSIAGGKELDGIVLLPSNQAEWHAQKYVDDIHSRIAKNEDTNKDIVVTGSEAEGRTAANVNRHYASELREFGNVQINVNKHGINQKVDAAAYAVGLRESINQGVGDRTLAAAEFMAEENAKLRVMIKTGVAVVALIAAAPFTGGTSLGGLAAVTTVGASSMLLIDEANYLVSYGIARAMGENVRVNWRQMDESGNRMALIGGLTAGLGHMMGPLAATSYGGRILVGMGSAGVATALTSIVYMDSPEEMANSLAMALAFSAVGAHVLPPAIRSNPWAATAGMTVVNSTTGVFLRHAGAQMNGGQYTNLQGQTFTLENDGERYWFEIWKDGIFADAAIAAMSARGIAKEESYRTAKNALRNGDAPEAVRKLNEEVYKAAVMTLSARELDQIRAGAKGEENVAAINRHYTEYLAQEYKSKQGVQNPAQKSEASGAIAINWKQAAKEYAGYAKEKLSQTYVRAKHSVTEGISYLRELFMGASKKSQAAPVAELPVKPQKPNTSESTQPLPKDNTSPSHMPALTEVEIQNQIDLIHKNIKNSTDENIKGNQLELELAQLFAKLAQKNPEIYEILEIGKEYYDENGKPLTNVDLRVRVTKNGVSREYIIEAKAGKLDMVQLEKLLGDKVNPNNSTVILLATKRTPNPHEIDTGIGTVINAGADLFLDALKLLKGKNATLAVSPQHVELIINGMTIPAPKVELPTVESVIQSISRARGGVPISKSEQLIITQRQAELSILTRELSVSYDEALSILNGAGVLFSGANSINKVQPRSGGDFESLHVILSKVVKELGGAETLASMSHAARKSLIGMKLEELYQIDIESSLARAFVNGASALTAVTSPIHHTRYRSAKTQVDARTGELSIEDAQKLVNRSASGGLNSTGTKPEDVASFYPNTKENPNAQNQLVIIEYPPGTKGAVINGEGQVTETAKAVREVNDTNAGVFVPNEMMVVTPKGGWKVVSVTKETHVGGTHFRVKVEPAEARAKSVIDVEQNVRRIFDKNAEPTLVEIFEKSSKVPAREIEPNHGKPSETLSPAEHVGLSAYFGAFFNNSKNVGNPLAEVGQAQRALTGHTISHELLKDYIRGEVTDPRRAVALADKAVTDQLDVFVKHLQSAMAKTPSEYEHTFYRFAKIDKYTAANPGEDLLYNPAPLSTGTRPVLEFAPGRILQVLKVSKGIPMVNLEAFLAETGSASQYHDNIRDNKTGKSAFGRDEILLNGKDLVLHLERQYTDANGQIIQIIDVRKR